MFTAHTVYYEALARLSCGTVCPLFATMQTSLLLLLLLLLQSACRFGDITHPAVRDLQMKSRYCSARASEHVGDAALRSSSINSAR